jgi:hypothetical protein
MPKFEELFPFLAKQIKEEKLNKIKWLNEIR